MAIAYKQIFRTMSDYQADLPEMDKINNQKVDWTAVTKEGNKFCQTLNKKLKTNPDTDQFKTDYIFQMNQLLDTVYDAINNKVPGLGDFLENQDLEQLQRPDWSRAMMNNDESRLKIQITLRIKSLILNPNYKIFWPKFRPQKPSSRK